MKKLMEVLLAVAFPPFGWVYVWWRRSRREGIEELGVYEMEEKSSNNPMGMLQEDISGVGRFDFGHASC